MGPRTPSRCTLPGRLTLLLEALSTQSTPSATLLATLTSEAWSDTPTVLLFPLTPRRCTPPRLPTPPLAVPSTTLPSLPSPTLPATLTPTPTVLSPPTLASLDSLPTPTAPLSQSSPLMWSPPGPSTLPHTVPREPSSLLETIY